VIPSEFKTIFSQIEIPRQYRKAEWEKLLEYYYDDRWRPQKAVSDTRDESIIRNDLIKLSESHPLAYVSGKAHFYGRVFEIAPGVLVPRPETEELVEWAIKELTKGSEVLDMGCGSGCIALTLAKERPDLKVSAMDASEAALEITRKNIERFDLSIKIEKDNILSPSDELLGKRWQCIISNPPYVRPSEASDTIQKEPDMALFTPEDDPLLFYRALCEYAEHCLQPSGMIYLELSEYFAQEIFEIFSKSEWRDCIIRKDLQRKPRMLRAIKR